MSVKSDSENPRIICEPSLTVQAFTAECDINDIVARAKRGEDISQRSVGPGSYGDFTGLPSYKDALLMVNKARDMFMSMDAFVRERFSNDPGRLLDFLNDPKNREEAVKLGLVKAPEEPKPDVHLETLKSIDSSLKGRKKGVGGQGSTGDDD